MNSWSCLGHFQPLLAFPLASALYAIVLGEKRMNEEINLAALATEFLGFFTFATGPAVHQGLVNEFRWD
jgi:hypothetical protein